MFPGDADVVIVGGGPAGCAAALALLRYTRHRVLVVERSVYATARVGETVSAAIEPFMAYLGVADILADARHRRSAGRTAAWGHGIPTSREALFDAAGPGWHLDRLRFDAGLAGAVAHAGGMLLRGTIVGEPRRVGARWHLRLRGRNAGQVTAKHLILATGATSGLPGAVGSSRHVADRLLALVAWAAGPVPPTILIEAGPDGWWYSAPAGEGAVVAYMTDADLIALPARDPAAFATRLKTAPLTAERMAAAGSPSPPRVFLAASHVASRCLGEGWVAAGDAAAAFDPLSSLGLGHALATGIHAARIVAQRLAGHDRLGAAYGADVARTVARYHDQRRRLYALERRWPDHVFWSRRRAGTMRV